MHGEEDREYAKQQERGDRERGRETVSATDEAASITDGWALWILTAPSGAQLLAESSPATAAAAAVAAGVEVVPAPITGDHS